MHRLRGLSWDPGTKRARAEVSAPGTRGARRHRWTFVAATWADAVAGWQAFREEVASGKAKTVLVLSFAVYVAENRKRLVARMSRGAARLTAHGLDGHLLRQLGSMRLDGIGPAELRDALTAMSAVGLAPATANRYARVAGLFVHDAAQRGVISRPVRVPRLHEPEKRREVTSDERQRFLDAFKRAPDHVKRLRPLFVLAVESGLRRSDLLGLRWRDVGDEFMWITTQKTGRIATVPISPACREALDALRAMKPDSETVANVSPRTYRRAFEEARDLAGLKSPPSRPPAHGCVTLGGRRRVVAAHREDALATHPRGWRSGTHV